MKELYPFVQEIAQRYVENQTAKQPRLQLKIKESEQEHYSYFYAGGTVELHAHSLQAAVYGLSHLEIGVQSGHLSELLGEWKPRFPLRPLWIKSSIPEEYYPRLCRRLLSLGYNSVILTSKEGVVSLKKLCDCMHAYGLKLFIKPNSCSKKSLSELFQDLPKLDGIFYQAEGCHSELIDLSCSQEATRRELMLEEMQLLRKAIPSAAELIYYLPAADSIEAAEQSLWLPRALPHVTENTILAFSAVSGNPTADHLPSHPLWEKLRGMPTLSSPALMPIINIGAVDQGEGLWPTLTFDLLERFAALCQRHHFAGLIGLVHSLPAEGSLLDCCLWVGAQIQWKERSIQPVASSWFAARRPDLDFLTNANALKELREVAINLSLLRAHYLKQTDQISREQCRCLIERLWVQVKGLELRFDSSKGSSNARPNWSDYYIFFARDARRLILFFIRHLQLSLPNLGRFEESGSGFWTSFQPSAPFFLDVPFSGDPGSLMSMIHKENREF